MKKSEKGKMGWSEGGGSRGVMVTVFHAVSHGSSSQSPEATGAQVWASNQKVNISIPLRLPASFPEPDFTHAASINLVGMRWSLKSGGDVTLSWSSEFPFAVVLIVGYSKMLQSRLN